MIKNFFLYFILLLLYSSNIFSETNKSIIIDGNENIDNDVIFSIIDEDLNNLDENKINNIIKKLFDSGYFKNVEIENRENEVIIKIIENPIINNINFIGNKRFKKEIIFEQFNKEDYFYNYNPNKIYSFIDDLTKLYNSFGYNLINITFEINEPENNPNFVDLNFFIDEGSISKIDKIHFIGNNNFDRRELLSNIKSKQKNLIKFFSNINFKKFQIKNDVIRLKNYYKNNGYKDVEVEYKTEFISQNNKFNIYFYINEIIAK